MSDPRPEKVAVVTEVREKFEAADAVLITEYRGLSVADLAALRLSLRGGGGEYRIYKNTFVRRAAADLGLEIADQLSGPTALAFVTPSADGPTPDVAAVAKALRDFAKDNPPLIVKGGILGDQILDPAGAAALASLPTAAEVYSRLAGAVNAQARGVAGGVAATYRSVAYALQAIIDSGHYGADEPVAEAPAEEAAEEPATEVAAEEPVEEAAQESAEPAAEMSTDDNTADTAEEESE
jgi:large subunit ribosomal protein L10